MGRSTMAERLRDPATEGGGDGPPARTLAPEDLPSLVESHADFVWRSLRRLGVPEGGADDATQQVFMIVAQKIGAVVCGKEKSFLFSVAMNVASHVRRSAARRREDPSEAAEDVVDPAPLPDAALDERRARVLLDEVLDAMPIELRTAFVLFELEEMTMHEIAEVLGVPQGTVASRLRRAREEFHKQAQRVRARVERRTVRPASHDDGGLRSSAKLALCTTGEVTR
jgi:RNA polymerase sigma-70 factor (ECF subfamily)